jgi:hypothetical protein
MGQWNIWKCFDLGHIQDSQIGLPLSKSIKRTLISVEVVWNQPVPSNRSVENPAKSDPIDSYSLGSEANDPACALIHHDQDPVGWQGDRFAPEQIDTAEAVLGVA